MKTIKIPFNIFEKGNSSYALVFGTIYTNILESENHNCYFTDNQIAEITSLSKITVHRTIKEIKNNQDLIVTYNAKEKIILSCEDFYEEIEATHKRGFELPKDSIFMDSKFFNNKRKILIVHTSLLSDEALTFTDALVYSFMYQFSKKVDNDRIITVPSTKIANKFFINNKTVSRSIQNLKANGYIKVVYPEDLRKGVIFFLNKNF